MERGEENTVIRFAVAVLTVGVVAAMLGAPRAGGQDNGQIRWLTDRRKAFEEAKRSAKPLWVLFR